MHDEQKCTLGSLFRRWSCTCRGTERSEGSDDSSTDCSMQHQPSTSTNTFPVNVLSRVQIFYVDLSAICLAGIFHKFCYPCTAAQPWYRPLGSSALQFVSVLLLALCSLMFGWQSSINEGSSQLATAWHHHQLMPAGHTKTDN
jgi:hypothetical protein